MPSFSKLSLERLSTCHKDLQRVAHEAIKVYDFTVLCGHRTKDEQELAFRKGNSKLRFPASKHNVLPSLAMDLAPWPLNWADIRAFTELSDVIKNVAYNLDIPLIWGGDWASFVDMPHYELNLP